VYITLHNKELCRKYKKGSELMVVRIKRAKQKGGKMKYLKLVLLAVFIFSCGLEASSVGFSNSGGYILMENSMMVKERDIWIESVSMDEEAGWEKFYGDIGKEREERLIRTGIITGAVVGMAPGLIIATNNVENLNVSMCVVGGGIVGGLSGYAYTKVFIASRPSKTAGVVHGVLLGGVMGAATYAAAGGLLFAAHDDPDGNGFGIFVGGIAGAVTGVVVGGFSGAVTANYLEESQSALINIQNENVGFGLPLPTLEVSSFSPDELQCSFDLVSVSF
jgi:hypothetical protein